MASFPHATVRVVPLTCSCPHVLLWGLLHCPWPSSNASHHRVCQARSTDVRALEWSAVLDTEVLAERLNHACRYMPPLTLGIYEQPRMRAKLCHLSAASHKPCNSRIHAVLNPNQQVFSFVPYQCEFVERSQGDIEQQSLISMQSAI